MKTYVVLIRDHSISMRPITAAALKDYNSLVHSVKQSVSDGSQAAVATVVCCGLEPNVRRSVVVKERNVPINNVPVLSKYEATGGSTPLFDSVMEGIRQVETVGDKDDLNTAFLVVTTTDGEENSSLTNAKTLMQTVQRLQATDKWTFVFRVPRGGKRNLVSMGIPDGNIIEWDGSTAASLNQSTTQTAAGMSTYFQDRSAGKTSTRSFFVASADDLSKVDIKRELVDVSANYTLFMVPQNSDGAAIKSFCIDVAGSYVTGNAFYQLTKKEEVQEYKKIIIRDRQTNQIYEGASARYLLGLPGSGTIKVAPGSTDKYMIFVQSTSVNRKLVGGTMMLYSRR